MIAVIMAGGLGTRLRPLTYSIPKPLLPIGDKPILEIIIEKLRSQNIREIFLMTGYRSELIQTYFGNGSKFGVSIQYVHEEKPLGTAGALSFLRAKIKKKEPFLVMNGDILTKLNFLKMRDFHIQHHAQMTIGSKKHNFQLPFGVLEIKNSFLLSIKEKPKLSYDISNGIYILNADVLQMIPKNSYFTMPDLANLLMERKCNVLCYPVKEYWIAVEQLDQFNEALTMKKRWM